jgi:hypothetical protein
MGWLTKEQIERARQVDVLDYILTHEPGNIKRVGSEYRLKDHNSLAVASGKWYWHSQGIGGKTALSYLTEVRGYGFTEAVYALTGEISPVNNAVVIMPTLKKNAIHKAIPVTQGEEPAAQNDNLAVPNKKPTTPTADPITTASPLKTPLERIPFALPLRHKNNLRVIAYLQSRGIDRDVILDCITNGSLYESQHYHNAVFTGRDRNGRTRFAALRGTTSGFKRDADGSDKRFGFILPPDDQATNEAAVFESPIDALSHKTLCKQGIIPLFNGWRLSLGGTSLIALEHFIKQHPQVAHYHICTDNDNAGEMAAAKIAAMAGITSERSPPVVGNDWNDTLVAIQKLNAPKTGRGTTNCNANKGGGQI